MKLSQIINNNYGTIAGNMSASNYSLLETGLEKMRSCVVEDFAYRKIDRMGKSTIFSTSPR